jgi:hypothetical protein
LISIEDLIKKHLRDKAIKKDEEHVASGYLSASRLDRPLLDNVLYLLGVKGEEIDDYALGLFARGEQVEDWVVSILEAEGMVERSQEPLQYITADGYVIVGLEDVKLKGEDFPTEIKSIKASQFKYLDTQGPKKGYVLQAATYALAQGAEFARILYITADDFRIKQFIIKAEDYRAEIDAIAKEVYETLQSKQLPQFKPKNEFERSIKFTEYTPYATWYGLYQEGLLKREMVDRMGRKYSKDYSGMVFVQPLTKIALAYKLQKEAPEAFKKLMEGDEKWQSQLKQK